MLKRKTRRKNSPLKKAENRCWKALRLAVLRRDGHKCQLSWYAHNCSEVMQGDHFISRRKKSVFFDIRNITCLCSSHNYTKSHDSACAYWVGKVVEEREGRKVVNELQIRSEKMASYTLDDLERWTEEFNHMYTEEVDYREAQ